MSQAWHMLDNERVLEELGSSGKTGLSDTEAAERLSKFGPNELKRARKKSPLSLFLDQFRDFMILVLIAAAVVSGIMEEFSDAAAIIAIVILNAGIGFIQEYRAENAMEALRQLAAPSAVVIRNGSSLTVPSDILVPGDIVVLEAGTIVPADIRIIESARLRIDEAALTGESAPVDKTDRAIEEPSLPVGDRINMAYKGTVVTYGRGSGVITATGMDTEFGKIASLLTGEPEVKTPLQKRLAGFGRKLAVIVLVICAVVFGSGMLRGEDPLLMFLTAVSLAVAAIPEALPAVITISLAIGAKKMVRRNALIRKLPAVETLGSVTYICTDKTGTLTMNKMNVAEIYTDGMVIMSGQFREQAGNKACELLFTSAALNNDAMACADGSVIGDPTELALFVTARDAGFDKTLLGERLPRVSEIPFDSDRKCMTTIHKSEGSPAFFSVTKGAPEAIISKSDFLMTSEGDMPLDKKNLSEINNRMAAEGLRVLSIAIKRWDDLPDPDPEIVESSLTILGLIGMMDPPRQEAAEAVSICRNAGIVPVMITGDHPLTARAIARRIGISDGDPDDLITGRELDLLTLEEFEKKVERLRVYARVTPEQKLKIIRALQDKGQFVAMTGDGVNDAPALKRADIGISMGITGTAVAKESSHMILLDDNFATIVKAVQEGRHIFDNIRKFVRYLLTTNSGEIWTLFLAPLAGLPIPLQPIQILWINLVTDGLPALALSAEPEEGTVMARPPRHPGESLFAHGLGIHALLIGLLMAAIVIPLQAWAIHIGDSHWQTMVFTVLCLLQLGHVLAIRSERESLFTQGILSNKPLFGAVALTVILQMATIYVPALNPIFKTQPLSPIELMTALGLSSVVFIAVEIEKLMRRRGILQ